MRITQVSASNWRNFKQIDVAIGSRLFVVGPNASGKSNLLDLFRFLGDIADPSGGLTSALESRGGLSKVRSLFARNHNRGRLVIEIALADGEQSWIYRLALKGEPGGKNRPVVDEEYVERDGVVLLQRPDSDDGRDPERLTQTHLEQISANQPFREIAEHLSRTRYFHVVPQIVRDPGRIGSGADPYGAGLIASINAVPAKTRNAWLRRMERALQAAVPEFETLSLEVDTAGVPHLVAGYKNWRKQPTKQNEADFSDGTLRLIGLLWMLVSTPANSGTLLLEEPELSLNAAIVRVLPTVLATAQRNQELQLIVSTHSPDLLDDEGVRPNEILVLRVTSDGSDASKLSEIEKVRHEVVAGLPKSEIVTGLVSPQDLSGLIAAGTSRR